MAAVQTTFNDSSFSGGLTINGPGTVVRDGAITTATIAATATGSVLDHVTLVGGPITNLAYDTEFRGVFNAATSDILYNFPSWRKVTPDALAVGSGNLKLNGTWFTSGTFQALTTPLAVTTTPLASAYKS